MSSLQTPPAWPALRPDFNLSPFEQKTMTLTLH